MSTHRQHYLDIPPAAPAVRPNLDERTWRETAKFLALFVLGSALLFALVFAASYWFSGGAPVVTPIPPAQITSAPLPSVSEIHARVVQQRLEDFRAGYEAALENACKLQPLLGTPIARSP